MTTAIDTNVLIALWQPDSTSDEAKTALDRAQSAGSLSICAVVYAELLAAPGRDARFIDGFLRDTSIGVDWEFTREDWRGAGRAFGEFAHRRRKSASHPRRILADFLIGAHASRRSQTLLSMDLGTFRTAFPELKLSTF